MTLESLALDGVQLNDNVSYVLESLSMPPPRKRLEWVAGADGDGSVLSRDPLFENRDVTVRVRVVQQASMDAAIDLVGVLVEKLEEAEMHHNGLGLVWLPAGATAGRAVTARVLTGEIEELPITWNGDDTGWFARTPVLTLRLTCKPFLYGTEILNTAASSTNPLITVELTGVPGDVPAEGRLIITDNATQNRRHVEWGLESRHYPLSSPPSLIVDSAAMVTSGFAGTSTTRTGAYSSDGVIRTALTQHLVRCCGLGNLTHKGTFRVKARIYAGRDIWMRLAWQAGSGPLRANDYINPTFIDEFAEVDLGLVTIPEAATGTQQWTGEIQAYTTKTSSEDLDIDAVWLIPAGEGYGVARSNYAYQPGVLVARDDFGATTAGVALNARVATLGGTWATSGAATDLVFVDAPEADSETARRTTTSDTGIGRLAILGSTNYTGIEVGVTVRVTEGEPRAMAIARHVDANNMCWAELNFDNAQNNLEIYTYISGTGRLLGKVSWPRAFNTWFQLRLIVQASGVATAQLLANGSESVLREVSGYSSQLATGGTLATGKPGFADRNPESAVSTRYYDNFYAKSIPAEQIAIYSGQSLEVRHDSTIREDSAGAVWGPAPSYRGSRFYVPAAGDENRKARVAVKARRNDIDATSDPHIADSLTVQVGVTPRYVAVPKG